LTIPDDFSARLKVLSFDVGGAADAFLVPEGILAKESRTLQDALIALQRLARKVVQGVKLQQFLIARGTLKRKALGRLDLGKIEPGFFIARL